MGLVTNKGKAVKTELGIGDKRGLEIQTAFINHLNAYSSLDEPRDKEIDMSILDDEMTNLKNPKYINFKRGLVTFSPSSASKCERELFYKALRMPKDEQTFLPYQRRWMRNGTAIHAAVQKDLLYAEKYLEKPDFKVVRMKAPASVAGRPAWESNLKEVRHFEDLGFQVFGMMDGVLEYMPDGSKVGFEFKTKSTTIAAVGDFKMKAPQSGHVEQCVAYSILFGLEEFILAYESIAKDGWNKGEAAKSDIKAFGITITDAQRQALIDKFIRVAEYVNEYKKDANAPIPMADANKCIFCPYKSSCDKGDGVYDTK